MGKSKRIRAERARDIATNPEKFASVEKKNNGSKKSKATSIIIIVLVAAILLAAIAATIIVNTGSVLRWQNAMSSENYTITGTMYSYIFYNIYNNYYSYFGNSITSLLGYIQSNAKSQAQQILALCEGAKAAGITLSDEDYATIDENIKNLEENLKTAGTNISAYFGNCGVSRDDVREVMILSTLASKYQEKKTEEFKPYMIKVTTSSLNIRKGAGTSYPVVGCIKGEGTYTIVAESNGWGKLKSGAGWISLAYTKRV